MNFKGIISILKGSGIIVSSKVVNNVSFLVITLLITKINNTESLGQYTIIFSVLNTLAIFALAGLGRYVNLTIPKITNFIHKCYINIAREIWKNPYLYNENIFYFSSHFFVVCS